MPYHIENVFSELVSSALAETEFIDGLKKTKLSPNDISTLLAEERDLLIQPVRVFLNDYDTLESTLNTLQETNPFVFKLSKIYLSQLYKQNKILLWLIILITSFWALFPLFQADFHYVWLDFIYDRIKGIGWVILVALTLDILVIIGVNFAVQWYRRVILKSVYGFIYRRNKTLIDDYEQGIAKQNLLDKTIRQTLLEKVIKEYVRRLINEQSSLSYSSRFQITSANGLSEVMNAQNTINTGAKNRLQFLLDNMPGGSIGIAGSRGAGKSTLIHTYCGSERSEPEIKGTKTIAVMTTAPVKYEARDFILYLFKSTCNSVLREESGDAFIDVESLTYNQIQDDGPMDKKKAVTFLGRLLSVCGFTLVYVSVLLFFIQILFSRPHQAASVVAVAKDTSAIKSYVAKHDSLASDDTTIAIPATGLYYPSRFITQLYPSVNTMTRMFGWGAGLLFAYFLLFSYDRFLILTIFNFGRRGKYMAEKEALKKEASLRAFLEEKPNLNNAVIWLKRIKFQQSFTTGWSGALKLPFALEGNMNRAMTFAERQMSYPEIIAAYRDFLQTLQLTYPVVIGIDELDKLDTEVMAQQFLNEIKSVFGVPNCFFLISVSENAMSNFERRGLPFRDVFDSSFDSIVYIEPFSLTDARTLLQRRIIGNPMPFFCLAQCLAGGLPRDIIRYFREVTLIAREHQNLPQITRTLIASDIDAKIRASMYALKKVEDSPETEKLLSEIFALKSAVTDLSNFHASLTKLAAFYRSMNDKIAYKKSRPKDQQEAEQIKNLEDIQKANGELYVYLSYMMTIELLFTGETSAAKMKKLADDGIVDLLTKARQLFSINHLLALDKINDCRRRYHFAEL